MSNRDDFSSAVKEVLAKRVGCLCSSPDCGRITTGPNSNKHSWTNLGVACHITAASPGGKRYDKNLTAEQRKHPDNGIWLCQSCGKLVDDDEVEYPVELLRKWKSDKELEIMNRLKRGIVPDIDGLPLAVSEPIQVGSANHVQLENGHIFPALGITDGTDTDPTVFVSGVVMRFILRPTQTSVATVIHAIGAEVVKVLPVPMFRPLAAVYPTNISLYTLRFGDPVIAGTKRFFATNFYRVSQEGGSVTLPYQPLTLETELPDVFDVRFDAVNSGMFVMKLFAKVSVGTTVIEQTLLPEFTIIVP